MIKVVIKIERGRVTEIEKEEGTDITDIELETIMNTTLVVLEGSREIETVIEKETGVESKRWWEK